MNSQTLTPSWHRGAACAGLDVNAFYPDATDAEGRREALAICGLCPVREECLAEVMAEEGGRGRTSRFGIRGGKTPSARFHFHKATVKAERDRLAAEAAA
ncbi:WhiB family transcriptional regulator [Streptomyces phage Ididsumtinwong]|uniref:WhiB family transcription factor n=2 Tax=Austintatiousvirus ididsumtinwong TaxID=2734220 RepID=A0A1J0MC52_9CAUD|nr:WhiB family transcriptional regulator [Streptomyces phage Ididsumtinwong]APD18516.1 WhiB family transcription factor [Streptomyces phage Ididsumtinwong]APD18735.1 WhiB family transcription factor [Streptomyces phage Bioscum]